MPEKFDPYLYKSYKELPEKQKAEFKEVEDGFVKSGVFSKEKAQEEARMISRIAITEAKGYKEAEREVESLKKKEMIALQKVQDINQEGVAYTVTKTSNLESIFENGILGYDHNAHYSKYGVGKEFGSKNSKRYWLEEIRRRQTVIYFNIVGRSTHYESDENKLEIDKDGWFNENKHEMVILFDISNIKESFDKEDKKHRHGFFYGYSDENRKEMSDINGFRLSDRIAPRFLKGIVLKKDGPIPYIIVEIISSNKIDEKYCVPIYDSEGNLWWPKKMSYEEVKKFVAERDKKKQGEKEK